MALFSQEINARISLTRRYLAQAREAQDDYLVEVRLGELESLSRIAADHGIAIDEPAEEHRYSATSTRLLDVEHGRAG